MNTWLLLAASVVGSAVVCRVVMALSRRWHLGGKPAARTRRAPHSAIPHLGGIAMAAVAWTLLDMGWRGWFAGSALLVATGLVDDLLWELPPWLKGVCQVAAAALCIQGGMLVQIVHLPSWLNVLLTLTWFVGMTNALNLLDIVDGLAGTVALVALAAFAVLASWSGQTWIMQSSLVVAGVVAGFLVWNWPPARLYMGDAGSQWLGFTLATIALAISYAPLEREVALVTPLVVLGLPIFDLLFVVWMRVRRGHSPFRKSRDHFALRLVDGGKSPRRIVVAMGCLALGFAGAGLFIVRAPVVPATAVTGLVIAVCVVWARRLARMRVDA